MKSCKLTWLNDEAKNPIDSHGRKYENCVDWKASPEEVLSEVNESLSRLGLEVVLGDDGSDEVFFIIITK